MKDKNIS